MKKRPLIVVGIALYYFVNLLINVRQSLTSPERLAAVATLNEIVVYGLSVALMFVIAVGLMLLKTWARAAAVVHLGINILSFIMAGFNPLNLSTVFEAVLIVCLFKVPVCARAFSKTPQA